MKRSLFLLPAALIFVLAANLSIGCKVSVNGRELDGLYSRESLRRAETAAAMAMEEISQGEPVPTEYTMYYRLTLGLTDASERELTDALLCASPGITKAYGVYLRGERLGTVENDRLMRDRIERFIAGQMPSWAVSGTLTDPVLIKREYTRAHPIQTPDDLTLKLSGLCPVLYFDEEGRVGRT